MASGTECRGQRGELVKQFVSVVVMFVKLLMIAAVGILGLACDLTPTPEQLRARADSALSSGDIRAAIIDLRTAVSLEPDEGGLRWLLGTSLLRVNDGAAAEKEFRRAHELGFETAEFDAELLRCLLLQQKYDEAISHEHVRPTALSRTLRGYALLAKRNFEQAVSAFNKVLEEDANFLRAHLGIVEVFIRQKELQKAEQSLEQAALIEPENSLIIRARGELAAAERDFAAASKYFSDYLEKESYDLPARLALARSLLALGDTKQAGSHLGIARTTLGDDPRVVYLEALRHFNEEDYTGVIAKLESLPGESVRSAQTLYLLGVTRYLTESYEQAREPLLRLRSNGFFEPGLRLLALTELRLGNGRGALDILAPMVEKYPTEPRLAALAARAAALDGNLALSPKFLKGAVTHTNSAALREKLAASRIALGDITGGKHELEKILAEEPTAGMPRAMLATSLLREGKRAAAIAQARTLISNHPENALGYGVLGAALAEAGELKAATDA